MSGLWLTLWAKFVMSWIFRFVHETPLFKAAVCDDTVLVYCPRGFSSALPLPCAALTSCPAGTPHRSFLLEKFQCRNSLGCSDSLGLPPVAGGVCHIPVCRQTHWCKPAESCFLIFMHFKYTIPLHFIDEIRWGWKEIAKKPPDFACFP